MADNGTMGGVETANTARVGSGRLCSLILQLFDAALLIKCHDYSSRIVHYALNYVK